METKKYTELSENEKNISNFVRHKVVLTGKFIVLIINIRKEKKSQSII